MSQLTIRRIVYCLQIMIFLAGCVCSPEENESFVVIPDGPEDGAVVNQYPVFTWHDNESCTPEKFQIGISFDSPTEKGGSARYPLGSQTEFTWPDPLTIGGRYIWNMAADMGANEHTGPRTETRELYVGPLCSGEVLTAPELYYPETHSWVSESGPRRFSWAYPGGICLPPYYEYEFASDSGFSNLVDSGMTPDYKQYVDKEFPNCSTLFWRVRAHDGTNPGPWSEFFDFHRVVDETCWQSTYISDDAARIGVWIYKDRCDYTGDPAGIKLTNTGCIVDQDGLTLVGNGQRTPFDGLMWGYKADLGSGPCPSTGLDHKGYGDFTFNVLAPGTYCISISRNQYAEGGAINLMNGIWTDPRTNEVVAYKTIEVGPGNSDMKVYFGWDEYDHVMVIPELPEGKNCRICPDPIGPIVDIFPEGSFVPIFGRDRNSEWKLSRSMGMPCYLWLENDMINKALLQYSGPVWQAEDLDFYPPSAPCPKPTPKPSSGVNCAALNEVQCLNNPDCDWSFGSVGPGVCYNK